MQPIPSTCEPPPAPGLSPPRTKSGERSWLTPLHPAVACLTRTLALPATLAGPGSRPGSGRDAHSGGCPRRAFSRAEPSAEIILTGAPGTDGTADRRSGTHYNHAIRLIGEDDDQVVVQAGEPHRQHAERPSRPPDLQDGLEDHRPGR